MFQGAVALNLDAGRPIPARHRDALAVDNGPGGADRPSARLLPRSVHFPCLESRSATTCCGHRAWIRKRRCSNACSWASPGKGRSTPPVACAGGVPLPQFAALEKQVWLVGQGALSSCGPMSAGRSSSRRCWIWSIPAAARVRETSRCDLRPCPRQRPPLQAVVACDPCRRVSTSMEPSGVADTPRRAQRLGPQGPDCLDRDPEGDRRRCGAGWATPGVAAFSAPDDGPAPGPMPAVDGVLFSASSPQLDDAARGMSFAKTPPTCAWIRAGADRGGNGWRRRPSADHGRSSGIWRERFAHAIAKGDCNCSGRGCRNHWTTCRARGKAVRTRELGQHPATRNFQALRIFINQELGS